MREIFEKRINIILIIVVLIVAVMIGIPLFTRGFVTSTSNGEIVTTAATTETKATKATKATKPQSSSSNEEIKASKVEIKKKNAKKSSKASASQKSDPRKTSSKTSSKSSSKSSSSSKVFATAETAETKADYNTQWNAGYLVAVDNPDKSYHCGHIELTDEDRDTIEKLCMGELGSGGFTGAALIAQAVKNAMFFDGYGSVRDVINAYNYTGKLTTPTKRVRDAVVYIFDMDKNAVQHRILYMYQPDLMPEGFSNDHESMRYICTYQGVRFFDR